MTLMRYPIDDLLEKGKPGEKLLNHFFSENSFPIIDPDGATFIYRGQAKHVQLQHWIYGLSSSQPLKRINDTDVWYLHFELPSESRIEYKFSIEDEDGCRLIMDPLNPLQAQDPFGANSVCQGYGYERPDWTLPDPSVPAGTLESFEINSRSLGRKHHTLVYLPARHKASRRYPLLVVHDGNDFRNFGSLVTVLDNLMHRQEIAPMIVALLQPENRNMQYAANPNHAKFLVEELIPKLAARYPISNEPFSRALLGASLGAVASLHTAWLYPGFFSTLLLLSGSFVFSDIGHPHHDETFEPIVEFVNAFRRNPGQVADRAYVACGVFESLIYENRSLAPLLQKHGVDVRFHEARDGHNWENWRDRMQDGLSWAFPGPLWLVYE